MKSWKSVVGYEDSYEISSNGDVRSIDRVVTSLGREPQKLKGRILKPGISSTQYLSVALSKGGKPKTAMVHALVAAAFLGPRPDKFDIDHINGDRSDNRVSNLRYVTHQVNGRNITKVNSRSGKLGVYPNGNGWMAMVSVGDDKKYLGTFRTIEEASAARERYEIEHDHRGFVADLVAMKERL